MTVMQKVLRNNSEYIDLTNFNTNAIISNKVLKKILYVSKITIITIGSMSLSLYITFLR